MKDRKILGDHARRGKKFVPPFVSQLGPLREISWIRTIIPELVWIGFLHHKFGDHAAVSLITSFVRSVRALESSDKGHAYAAASHYLELDDDGVSALRENLKSQRIFDEFNAEISPLVMLYPEYPLARIALPSATENDLDIVTNVVGALFDREERFSMMVQASAVWLMFDADLLKVNPDLALAQFPEIEKYPDTDLSLRIGSGIRAVLNMMFGQISEESKFHFNLPSYFWNRGYQLSRCKLNSMQDEI